MSSIQKKVTFVAAKQVQIHVTGSSMNLKANPGNLSLRYHDVSVVPFITHTSNSLSWNPGLAKPEQ
jgi:hypothetical protein